MKLFGVDWLLPPQTSAAVAVSRSVGSISLLTRLKCWIVVGAGVYVLTITQSIAAATLTIHVDNVTKSSGQVMVAVLPGEAGFKDETPAAAAMMKAAQPGRMTFTATDLANGSYAIRVMHDVNDNGKLDANFIGMPTEPWGMSNNARGNFGPPKWADVKFEVDGDTVHTVELSQ